MQITEILYTRAREKQHEPKKGQPETTPHKCAYPGCGDRATWDSYCWFHYQEEHYTSR